MLRLKRIEVAARRLKVRGVTLANLVDVDTVFPRRKPASLDGDVGPTCGIRCKSRDPDGGASRIPELHCNRLSGSEGDSDQDYQDHNSEHPNGYPDSPISGHMLLPSS